MDQEKHLGRAIQATEVLERRCLLASIGIDRSFGHRGVAEAAFDVPVDLEALVAEVADQKMLVVGSDGFDRTQPSPIALARFNADGTLDTTFDGDGTATPFVVDSVAAATVQADGKVLVVGKRGGAPF